VCAGFIKRQKTLVFGMSAKVVVLCFHKPHSKPKWLLNVLFLPRRVTARYQTLAAMCQRGKEGSNLPSASQQEPSIRDSLNVRSRRRSNFDSRGQKMSANRPLYRPTQNSRRAFHARFGQNQTIFCANNIAVNVHRKTVHRPYTKTTKEVTIMLSH
jgi:hypothetical protein